MKKYFKYLLAVVLLTLVAFSFGSTLTTRMANYRTLDTLTSAAVAVDTDLAAATGYAIGAISGEVDLRMTGYDTYANLVSITLHAVTGANGDTLTQKLYGRVDGGPPQLLASIVWTIGTARVDGATATYLWADTAVVTSTHMKTFVVADGGGSDRVCSVTFDATGYRYLYSLITAQTGNPTLITVLYRYF